MGDSEQREPACLDQRPRNLYAASVGNWVSRNQCGGDAVMVNASLIVRVVELHEPRDGSDGGSHDSSWVDGVMV